MPRIIILIFWLISASISNSQEWFPIGASWYYNQIHFGIGESYNYFEVTGEIVIQGKTCKIISGSCNCGVPGIGSYLYQEGDKIYVFDFEVDSFRILYDFTLEPGDTIIFPVNPPFTVDGQFLLDSITFVQVGTQILRVQHITHLAYEVVWGDKIIERIGSNGCMYPQVSFCDPGTGDLRCYEDDEIGLINFQIPLRPCTYVTSTNNLTEEPGINVFPNPASSSVFIQSETPMERLIVFNSLSIPLYQYPSIGSTEFEFNVLHLPDGIFHIQFLMSNHQIAHRSIIIQK